MQNYILFLNLTEDSQLFLLTSNKLMWL